MIRINLYYDPDNNKAYRLLYKGFHNVNFKEIKTNTGRAKMNERIIVMPIKEWLPFSNRFIPIHKSKHLCMMANLTKSFKDLNLTT